MRCYETLAADYDGMLKCLDTVTKKDVYTIGDGDSDIPMTTYGRNGFCIDLVEDSVKVYARHTC